MTHDYQFRTVWRVPGTCEEVAAVLGDAGDLARWWPAVYLTVRVREAGVADGGGRMVGLRTTGALPYTLRWTMTVTEPVTPAGFALTAIGDLNREGRWAFVQDGPEAVVTYDWRVSAAKSVIRRLTWLLRPAFEANHRWAMRRGEESLKLELRLRRAGSGQERGSIPPPPGPTFRARVNRRP